MKRLFRILLPGWERFMRAQRAACVDFGISVSLLLLFCCSKSVLLCIFALLNCVRSYFRLVDNSVDIEE